MSSSVNKKNKKRADEFLVDRQQAESRSKAQAYIMAGHVYYKKNSGDNWQRVEKAGQFFSEDVQFDVRDPNRFDVSRGAQKLRHAFECWPLNILGAKALDVGASTGGFTQVLLEKGAAQVLALDVGTHQLHERLRRDPRVLSIEEQHVLHVDENFWTAAAMKPPFDVIVTDVSFISLTKIIGHIAPWLRVGGDWIMLVKPQFELEAKKVPGGVVKDANYRQEAVLKVQECVKHNNLIVKNLTKSPITRGDGNIEYLLWAKKE